MVQLARASEHQREAASRKWEALRPHLEDGVPLTAVAAAEGVPLRTAQRWLANYRRDGLAALVRAPRSDAGVRRLPADEVALIEGLALRRPAPSAAHVHRRVRSIAAARGWPVPSYATVRSITTALDDGLVTLAHDGPAAYRDRFELVHRREAEAPNSVWQADHTQLDMLVLDDRGQPARPWLTLVIDDFSRAVAGYAVNLDAPSALQTALALRQAIWRKPDPTWTICGIPDVLYTDHGSDFVSQHLEQVAADLRIQLINSTAGVPQGRGKIERLFGTINTELLPTMPGYLGPSGTRVGRTTPPPRLTLASVDSAIADWLREIYHARAHAETGQPPLSRWAAGGWLPRLPESLEQLDLLLLTVAKPRIVHRDGIRFQGTRYLDLALAAYVTEPVTIRYDPRDLGEIRVYHQGQFICRAISPDFADATISLRELQAARNARRRELRTQLNRRVSLAEDVLPADPLRPTPTPPAPPATPRSGSQRLRRYREDP